MSRVSETREAFPKHMERSAVAMSEENNQTTEKSSGDGLPTPIFQLSFHVRSHIWRSDRYIQEDQHM